MWVELLERNGKYYVLLRHEEMNKKPVAQFVSTVEIEAANVAKYMARHNKCFVKRTSGGITEPELPPQPDIEG